MKIKKLDRALFIGLFVGIIIFIKEFFFPDTNAFLSILISALAALIGYFVGGKLLSRSD
ncbi:hypothetical protein [Paraliobacillus sp. JSM ZJ581]|uniref:hypothetical protein n=1 Tax=Paraliobacillus sp. JSM ZJ581 TaxID=3342118 RepID=UPI0035A93BE7